MICNKPNISFWVRWQVPLGQEFRSSTLICKTALHQVSFPRKANHKVVFLSLIWLLFCELLSSWTLQCTEGAEDVASPLSVVIKNTGLQWVLLIQREILAGVIWLEGSEERGGDHECSWAEARSWILEASILLLSQLPMNELVIVTFELVQMTTFFKFQLLHEQ